jgi:hypothetical protein
VAIAHATPANGLRVGRFIVLMGPPIGSLRMWPLAGLIEEGPVLPLQPPMTLEQITK